MKIKWCTRANIKEILSLALAVLTVGALIISAIPPVMNIYGIISTILLSLIISYIVITVKRTIRQQKVIRTNGKTITIKSGNIFEENDITVIPVNCCFDTVVDDDLISSKSIHGQFINHYCHDIKSLDELIEKQLPLNNYRIVEKKSGKNKEYNPGTIVSVKKEKQFIFLALTKFDTENVAECELPDYCKAVVELLSYLNDHCQGNSVSMPLIGGGLSRIGAEPGTILELLVTLIKTHKDAYPRQITIVLNKKTFDDIDLDKIQ